MKTSYRERDYAFGAAMLTLRTAIGLTQKGLANLLGISRRAVGEWETGNSYPKVEHLKQVIALAVKLQAFPVGNEAPEIRKLWKAAHQKVLLDERWLFALLEQTRSPESARYSDWPGKQIAKTHEGTEAYPSPQIETEERKELVVIPIYPTGWGRFALGSPSGKVLYPGQSVEILLAGYRIAGMIHASALGDYFQAADGMSCCGLCAGMCVVASYRYFVDAGHEEPVALSSKVHQATAESGEDEAGQIRQADAVLVN